MIGRTRTRSFTALVLALWASSSAFAQANTAEAKGGFEPWPKAYAQLGVFLINTESTFLLGISNVGLGINLAVEKFLDLEATNTAFRIDGGWRFTHNRRHKLTLSWFRLNREGTTTTTKDIELPDSTVISVGTGISSIFNFAIVRLKYNYSFVLDERIDLNIGAGVYLMPVTYGLGEIGEPRTEQSTTAPLPVISVGFNVGLSPNWYIRQSAEWMYLEISGIAGRIVDLTLSIERTIYKRIALGLGLEALDISFDTEKDSSYPGVEVEGQYGFKYSGVQLYVRGNF